MLAQRELETRHQQTFTRNGDELLELSGNRPRVEFWGRLLCPTRAIPSRWLSGDTDSVRFRPQRLDRVFSIPQSVAEIYDAFHHSRDSRAERSAC